MKINVVAVCVLSIGIASCAKRPDAIVPVDIPIAAYSGMNCNFLATELATEKTTLATLSSAQESAANADAVGVFLVGVPAGSVTGGDKEGLIAVSKGKVQAIEAASKSNGC